jgi:hypothetical protein
MKNHVKGFLLLIARQTTIDNRGIDIRRNDTHEWSRTFPSIHCNSCSLEVYHRILSDIRASLSSLNNFHPEIRIDICFHQKRDKFQALLESSSCQFFLLAFSRIFTVSILRMTTNLTGRCRHNNFVEVSGKS